MVEDQQVQFSVTGELVTAATRRFWLSYIGRGGILRWLGASCLIVLLAASMRQPLAYALILVMVLGFPLLWVLGYFVFLRRAFHRFDRMESKVVTFRFTEQGLGSQSDLGSADIPWRMLDRIQCYPDVWLLYFGSRDYAYLPAAEITAETRSYIHRLAKEHGIKATGC